jgi:hypothetical protein
MAKNQKSTHTLTRRIPRQPRKKTPQQQRNRKKMGTQPSLSLQPRQPRPQRMRRRLPSQRIFLAH